MGREAGAGQLGMSLGVMHRTQVDLEAALNLHLGSEDKEENVKR